MNLKLTNIERRRLIILAFVLAAIVAVVVCRSRRLSQVDTSTAAVTDSVSVDSVRACADTVSPMKKISGHRKRRGAVSQRRSHEPAERDRLDEPVRSHR